MHRFSTSHDAARTATLSIWPWPKYETEVILRRSKIAKGSQLKNLREFVAGSVFSATKWNLKPKTASLIPRRVRRPAHMQMTQIMQSLPVLIAHSPREIRIAQPPVSRRLRHILQHTQLLLNHLLPLPRNLPPSRQNVVLHVAPLFRRHSPPGIFFRAKVRALLRVQVVPLIKLLPNPALLFRRQILERTAALQHAITLLRIQITHAVHEGTRRANTNLLPRPQRCPRSAFVRPPVFIRSIVMEFIRPAIKIV